MHSLETDCQTVKQKIDSNHPFLLLDCREQEEHTLVNIPVARLLPMSEIQDRISELEDQREAEIIVYCHHGMRSQRAGVIMASQGFDKLINLVGGIDAWACNIAPEMKRY